VVEKPVPSPPAGDVGSADEDRSSVDAEAPAETGAAACGKCAPTSEGSIQESPDEDRDRPGGALQQEAMALVLLGNNRTHDNGCSSCGSCGDGTPQIRLDYIADGDREEEAAADGDGGKDGGCCDDDSSAAAPRCPRKSRPQSIGYRTATFVV